MHNNDKQLNYEQQVVVSREMSVPGIALCIALFLVVGIAPTLPSPITQPLRPVVILICFLIPSRYTYKTNKAISVLLLYFFYMTLVFLSHSLTTDSFMAWMSDLLFGLFFIVLSQRMWSGKEIRAFVFTVFISGVLYAALLLRETPDLFHNTGNLSLLGHYVNDNAAAYDISPAALSGAVLFLNYRRNKKNSIFKLFILAGTLFCYYILICLGQRGAFFSSVIGAAMIIWERTKYYPRKKIYLRALLLIIIAIGLVVGPRVTEGTHAERLFDYEHITDDNGRDQLNDRAKELIKEKPIFGGGYQYWEQESGFDMGLHNGFYLSMVIGGYIAGFLISAFFIYLLYDIYKRNSLISLAFVVEAGVHMFVDSGLDYYSYIPLIIAYILVRYSEFSRIDVSKVFISE